MKNALGVIAGLGVLLTAPMAMAQGEPPPATQQPQQPPPPPAPPSVSTGGPSAVSTGSYSAGPVSTGVPSEKKDDGLTDHERVVGKFGVGYFGVTQQPIATGGTTGAAFGRGSVNTPVIGMRYWLQERLGIDAGLGFNFFSSSTTAKAGGTETTIDGPAVIAFTIHGGLPLAFAYGKHYKFLVIPELNFGYATQTEKSQPPAPGQPAPPRGDIHRTGLRLDLGARVGTEIQFGFIGIPELALQASVGLNFRYRLWRASQDAFGPSPESSTSDSQFNLGTTVQSDPWALFVNNVSAIYYFP